MGKQAVLFSIGGGSYVALELLWRGRSHWTMFMLGGGCFLALGRISPRLRPLTRMALGSAVCTAGELAVGLLFNRDHRIWDYRMLPGNFRGQICPLFSLLWAPLSLAGGNLCRWLDTWISGKDSHYFH